MVAQFMSPNPSEESFQAISQELVDLLTQAGDIYPWNPADIATDAYFEQLETQFSLTDAFDVAELDLRANNFFAIAQQAWNASARQSTRAALWEKFAQYIPSQRLEAILDQAETLVSQNLSQINQLVECVRPLWSNWSEEDLQVFARPLALSMRGDSDVEQGNWDEMTEIKQIRLTMLAAQEALTELAKDAE